MKARVAFLFFLTVLAAPLLFGETLTMGVDITTPNASDNPVATTRTDISLDNPASATGSVTSVKIPWSNSGCRWNSRRGIGQGKAEGKREKGKTTTGRSWP